MLKLKHKIWPLPMCGTCSIAAMLDMTSKHALLNAFREMLNGGHRIYQHQKLITKRHFYFIDSHKEAQLYALVVVYWQIEYTPVPFGMTNGT